jgi:hypothetical protein
MPAASSLFGCKFIPQGITRPVLREAIFFAGHDRHFNSSQVSAAAAVLEEDEGEDSGADENDNDGESDTGFIARGEVRRGSETD